MEPQKRGRLGVYLYSTSDISAKPIQFYTNCDFRYIFDTAHNVVFWFY